MKDNVPSTNSLIMDGNESLNKCLYSINAIIDKVSQSKLEYRHLIKSDESKVRHRWKCSFARELGRLTQGLESTPGVEYLPNIKGTNTMKFIPYENIPGSRRKDVTYGRIVVDFRPLKSDTNRTRLTVGGNNISYPGIVYTPTADITLIKMLLNSTISTKGARFFSGDIPNFYLSTHMDRKEYMFLPVNLIPDTIIHQYKLKDMIKDGKVYVEISKGMYGLPQAGRLANLQLINNLAKHGYHPCRFTPGLWRHKWRPVKFVLVVDDFGI